MSIGDITKCTRGLLTLAVTKHAWIYAKSHDPKRRRLHSNFAAILLLL
jgi:hypothetical protein